MPGGRFRGPASRRAGRVRGDPSGALSRPGLRRAGRMTGGGRRALRGPDSPRVGRVRGGASAPQGPGLMLSSVQGTQTDRARQSEGPPRGF